MTTNGARPTRQRVTLTDISSRAWEHPADRGALVALRQLQRLRLRPAQAVRADQRARVPAALLGSAIRIDERQFPTRAPALHRGRHHARRPASCPSCTSTTSRSGTQSRSGWTSRSSCSTRALLDGLDEEETRFVLGHELGHAQSGHALYQSLLFWLMRLTGALSWVPLGALGLRAIIAALQEWSRKAELSGDRAGLLAVQDPAVALRVQMKMASGGELSQLDTTAFLAQGTEYESRRRPARQRAEAAAARGAVPPVRGGPSARAAALGGRGRVHLDRVRALPERQDDATASMSQEAKNAAKSYADAFSRSQDPLAKFLRDIGVGTAGVREWMSAGSHRARRTTRPRATRPSRSCDAPPTERDGPGHLARAVRTPPAGLSRRARCPRCRQRRPRA